MTPRATLSCIDAMLLESKPKHEITANVGKVPRITNLTVTDKKGWTLTATGREVKQHIPVPGYCKVQGGNEQNNSSSSHKKANKRYVQQCMQSSFTQYHNQQHVWHVGYFPLPSTQSKWAVQLKSTWLEQEQDTPQNVANAHCIHKHRGNLDFPFLRTRGNLGLFICVHYRGNLGLFICVHYRGNLGLFICMHYRGIFYLCALQRESWTFYLCALQRESWTFYLCALQRESWTVHGAHWNLGLSIWVHCVRGNAGIPRL